MKQLALALFVFGFVATASAETFNVEMNWCNGPIATGGSHSCPSFGAWEGLLLKKLTKVTFPNLPGETLVALENSDGQSWSKDLSLCVSRPSDPRGCKHTVDTTTKPGETSISISAWEQFRGTQTLLLTFDPKGEISVLAPDNSHLVFKAVPDTP